MANDLTKLPVDHMAMWVNETLLADMSVEISDQHGVNSPIRRNTVHGWMRRVGTKNEVYQKGSHNDKHEDPSVLVDRQVSAGSWRCLPLCGSSFLSLFYSCPFHPFVKQHPPLYFAFSEARWQPEGA
jgi:hypothetical protein